MRQSKQKFRSASILRCSRPHSMGGQQRSSAWRCAAERNRKATIGFFVVCCTFETLPEKADRKNRLARSSFYIRYIFYYSRKLTTTAESPSRAADERSSVRFPAHSWYDARTCDLNELLTDRMSLCRCVIMFFFFGCRNTDRGGDRCRTRCLDRWHSAIGRRLLYEKVGVYARWRCWRCWFICLATPVCCCLPGRSRLRSINSATLEMSTRFRRKQNCLPQSPARWKLKISD